MSKLKLRYPDSRHSSPSDDSDQDHDGSPFDSEDQDEEEEGEDDEDHDDDVIRCVCGSTDDGGFCIQCEVCETWQHGRCVNITRKSVPDHYICKFCLNIKKKKTLPSKQDRSLSPQNRRKVINEITKDKKKKNVSKGQRLATTTKKRVHYNNQDSSSDSSSDDEQLQQQLVRNSKNKIQKISKNIMKEKIVEDLYVEIRRQWMELHAQSSKKLISPGNNNSNKGLESIIGMETNLLLPAIPKHKVLPIRKSLRTNYAVLNKDPSIQQGVFADQGMPSDRFVLEVIGEAAKKIKDNTSLGTPPAHVFFYPNLDLCLDTRHVGNDARYIRRSCRPNSELKGIILKNNEKDQMVHLGVYTKKAVDRQDEITIGWNWINGHIMWKKNKEFKTKDYDPPAMNATQRKLLQQTLDLLNTEFGECACEDEDKCLFVYLKDELERSNEENEDSEDSLASVTKANKRKRPGISFNNKPRNKPSSKAKVIFTSDEEEEDHSPKSTKKTRPNAVKKQFKLKGKETSSTAVSVDGSVDIDITTMSPVPASQPSSDNESESIGRKRNRLISPDKSLLAYLPVKKRWLRLYLAEMERKAEATPKQNIPRDKLTARKSQASPTKSPQETAKELNFDDGELSDGGSSQSTLPLDDASLVRLQETAMLGAKKRDVTTASDSKQDNDTTPMAVDESLTKTKKSAVEEKMEISESSIADVLQQQTASTKNTASHTTTSEVKTSESQAPKVRISLQEYLQRQQG